MTVYSIHVRDTGLKPDLALVKDGFSWPAAIFGFFWALVLGAWDVALVLLAVQIVAGLALPMLIGDATALSVVQLGVSVLIGLIANELRRWSLDRRGMHEEAIVTAHDKEEAERRYLDANPYMTAKLLRD
ncbi:DUF2628 domain-containing protein [Magnetovibrio blakemorei]|uniref:DUF2628 domain-containing protein n=1 Tax=Magnetovibrio blakemorei TaxID=28181 RepID=A0A1E5Q3Q2_9PROT|nr:DUF2628 domain-containing protein [Magnetovibrio blakemorei]OEJ64405.1 hypothetical protein BEN30_16480 [Magnetovibrio blakemorei]